jgi:hypothetical protein
MHGALGELLADKMPADKAEELADALTRGAWTHDYPITFEDAQGLGLPVRDDMPEEVLQLLSLYPQPIRHSGSVEYLPVPRHSGDRQKP